jgi:hypothetical protein
MLLEARVMCLAPNGEMYMTYLMRIACLGSQVRDDGPLMFCHTVAMLRCGGCVDQSIDVAEFEVRERHRRLNNRKCTSSNGT